MQIFFGEFEHDKVGAGGNINVMLCSILYTQLYLAQYYNTNKRFSYGQTASSSLYYIVWVLFSKVLKGTIIRVYEDRLNSNGIRMGTYRSIIAFENSPPVADVYHLCT